MLATPLTDYLKSKQFIWTESQQESFETVKSVLATSPVLALPDLEQPFVVETDASATGVGVVLMQFDEPIEYFSEKLCLARQMERIRTRTLCGSSCPQAMGALSFTSRFHAPQ